MAKDQPQQPTLQIPEVYSNVANIHFNQYEFEVTFGLGSANYEGIKPALNMRMSPQFAKELAKILNENVEQYEQMVGQLPESAQRKKR